MCHFYLLNLTKFALLEEKLKRLKISLFIKIIKEKVLNLGKSYICKC